jgi:hypothetical protein
MCLTGGESGEQASCLSDGGTEETALAADYPAGKIARDDVNLEKLGSQNHVAYVPPRVN